MDSDVATNFTLSLRTGGSEGARGENLTAQSLEKLNVFANNILEYLNIFDGRKSLLSPTK